MKKQLLSLATIAVSLTMFVGCKDGVSDNPEEVSTTTSMSRHHNAEVQKSLFDADHPGDAASVQGLSFAQPAYQGPAMGQTGTGPSHKK